MRQPTKQVKRALRHRLTKIRKCWPRERFWPSYSVVFLNTSPPDATQRIRIRAEDVVIGESVSWHLGSDKDGNAVAIYEEDEETVKKFYESHART